MISIGGTQFNEVTKLFLDQIDPPYDVRNLKVKDVIDNATGKIYRPIIEDFIVKADYGILTKMRNPFNLSKWVVIFRGSHTFGTAGAARMMTSPYLHNLLSEEKNVGAKDWQALIKTTIHGTEVFPELVAMKPLNAKPEHEAAMIK